MKSAEAPWLQPTTSQQPMGTLAWQNSQAMRWRQLTELWSLAGTMTASSLAAAARRRLRTRPKPAVLVGPTLHRLQMLANLPAALGKAAWRRKCALPLLPLAQSDGIFLRNVLHCHAESMAFSVDILRGIKRKGYQLPTPIQRKAMPAILAGADVVGMARTGSGKTAAFVLPMLQR